MTKKSKLACLAFFSVMLRSQAGYSQCLTLPALTTEAAAGQLSVPRLTPYLPAGEWQIHEPSTGAVYWTYEGIEANKAAPMYLETRLELRRTNQEKQYDLVYKFTDKSCFNALRGELRRARFTSEPVNCVLCEAEQYFAPIFTVVLYNQSEGFALKKAPYPFVMVVHKLPAAGRPATSPPAAAPPAAGLPPPK